MADKTEFLQAIDDAILDADSLEQFINGSDSETVLTRLSAEYPTLQNAIKQMFEKGGLPATPFATKALMTASALVDGDYAQVTDDTDNNGLYVKEAGAWVKSDYDPLGQAKTYADENKLDLSQVETGYADGNMVGIKTKLVKNKGLNAAARTYIASGSYDSKVIRVEAGDVLYFLNDRESYDRITGFQFGFFDSDPSVNESAVLIMEVREFLTDSSTNLKYARAIVPDGATHLVFNTRFSSTEANWSIHKDFFSTDYTAGKEVLKSVNNAVINKQLDNSLVRELKVGNTLIGDIYQPDGILINSYITSRGSISGTTSVQNWQVFRFSVKAGDTYYVRVTSSMSYPFRAVYSTSTDTVHENSTLAGTTTFVPTEQENIYKITVPTGLDIVAVFMNIKVDSGAYSFNIVDTLSIQKNVFDDEMVGVVDVALDSINGHKLVDGYARQQIGALSTTKSRLTGKKVFAFGDSITEGTQGGYVKYLTQAFDTTVNNYGSSGAKSSRVADIVTAGEGLPRRDAGTASYTWEVKDYTDLACATLMVGTNDSSGSSFGTVDSLPTTYIGDYTNEAEYWALFPNNYVGNIALIIEFIKSKAPNAEIHLVAPPYLHSSSGTSRITQLIPVLEEVSNYYGVHLIYATYESGISYKLMNGDLDIYSYDGVHFNELGNEVFGKFLAQKVLSFG